MPFSARRRALQVLALAGLGLAAVPGAAQQPPPLRLHGFTENLAPLNYEDELSGRASGFSVELLRLMAEQAGLPLDIEVLPWPRAVQAIPQTPNSLLFSLTRTPEREAQYQWIGPISPRRILVYRLSSRKDIQLRSLQQLKGLTIGVVRESAAARQLLADGLKPEEELEWARDDATNIRKLLAGRMDLLVMLDWAAGWHLRQLQLPYTTLTSVLPLDVSKSYWYGMPADTDPALLRRLQAALDRLKRDGRYDQLRQRYFN